MTVVLAVLDPETGKLRYSSVGHPPAMIRRADGSVELLKMIQVPVGIIEKNEYREEETQMEPGDNLLMYTDGIGESHSGSRMYDIEGVEKTFKEQGGSTPEVMLGALFRTASDYGNGSLTDDAAVVIIERIGSFIGAA